MGVGVGFESGSQCIVNFGGQQVGWCVGNDLCIDNDYVGVVWQYQVVVEFFFVGVYY